MKYAASTRPTVRKKILSQPGLDLGLASDGLDGRAAGEAVTDGRADGAAAEGEPTADERAGDADRRVEIGICCHGVSSGSSIGVGSEVSDCGR